MLEAVAAKVQGEPCVAWLRAGAAGHYVKMVHNGIEYGVMQILAEAYDLLHRGLGLDYPSLADLFAAWNERELKSFLVEITAKVLPKIDDQTGKPLVEMILDVARQKGTGKWTSKEGMDLQAALLTIDAAVALRDISAYHTERAQASKVLAAPAATFSGDKNAAIAQLEQGCQAAILATYGQGFAILRRASEAPVQPRPGDHRTNLARRLHHPLEGAGRHTRRLRRTERSAELSARSTSGRRVRRTPAGVASDDSACHAAWHLGRRPLADWVSCVSPGHQAMRALPTFDHHLGRVDKRVMFQNAIANDVKTERATGS